MDKVLITTSSFGNESREPLKMICDAGYEPVINPFNRKISEDELTELLSTHKPKYLIAGTETISRRALELAKPFLRLISRCGTGMDNVDLRAASELGIEVTNTPDAPVCAVAELTVGVMLDLLRGISNQDRDIRSGGFEKRMGNLLSGKTVGLIGCGKIGTEAARLLKAFGCRVTGYDRFINTHESIDLLALDELLKTADIISMHIPYSDKNKHIVNAETISKMKDGVIILNISRGGLVDESALYAALKNGKIKAAGIDCFEKEPYSGNLTELANVVLTPHIGSYAVESRIGQEIAAVKNIMEYVIKV